MSSDENELYFRWEGSVGEERKEDARIGTILVLEGHEA
jgi:hypothetical protein